MMNTRLWYIFMPLAFLLAASLLTSGCQKEVSVTGSADRLQSDDIVVRLRIGCPPVTRSSLDPIENEGEYTLGFTAEEHKINSLTLIMMRVVNGREVFEMARTVDISEMTDTDKDGYLEAEFELAGVKGLKHFYVGANMTPQHVGAFTVDDKVMILDTDTDGHNITGQLMTVDHNTGAGSDVLMTGTLTINGNPDIVIDDIATDGAGTQLIEKKDGKLVMDLSDKGTVSLDKAVAKVLLTCKTVEDSSNGNAYVVDAKDEEGNNGLPGGNTGWIKTDNVRYLLNVMNRREYAVFREDASQNLIDPNYEMSDFIEYRSDRGGYGLKNLEHYESNFIYYDTQDMTDLLTGDTPPVDGDCRRSTVLPYDEKKLDKSDPSNHYTDGLYCPENMVHKMDFKDGEEDEFMSVNRFVSTHLVISARYTPRQIWVAENGKLEQKTFSSEDNAKNYLPEITSSDIVPLHYQQGTFWYETKDKEYYSFDAMKLKNENSDGLPEDEKPSFTRYDGGWCYYFSFIDGNNTDGIIDYNGQDHWGVKRNHYYIVNVTKIVAPGSAYPGNEMMRIHSELLDWIDKGGSDVELDVPQQ